MKKIITFCLIVTVLGAWIKPKTGFAEGWAPIHQPNSGELGFLRTSQFGASHLLFASERGDLLTSADDGKTWERTLRLRGAQAEIHDVKAFLQNPADFYVLTTDGLLQFDSRRKTWETLYQAIGAKNRNVLSLAQNPINPDGLYLGTEQGVLISKDRGKHWSNAFAELGHRVIFDIVADERNRELYFATDRGVFRYHLDQDTFRLVFNESVSISEESDFENADDDEGSVRANTNGIHLILTRHERYSIVIAGKSFVAISNDEGEAWEKLSQTGFPHTPILDVVYSEALKTLLIATEQSIFQFDETVQDWKELYEGLPSTHIHSLTIKRGSPEKLYAATQHGIFSYELKPEIARINAVQFLGAPDQITQLNRLFASEPSIRDIQEAAIRYANVSNSKIRKWHYASRLSALLPSISFSKNLDVGNTIHVDTGSTTSPDIFTQGPDDRSKSTDLNVGWDLGDFIWSSSQTSIDSREKLMVELRDEILAEVTRLYFERKRAELDFFSTPPADPAESIKAQMRIEELTANLDALTGGYFSKRLQAANSIREKL